MSRTQNHNVPTRSDCSAPLQEWLELRQPFQQYCDTKPWEQLVIEDVLVVNVARWMLESPLRGTAGWRVDGGFSRYYAYLGPTHSLESDEESKNGW